MTFLAKKSSSPYIRIMKLGIDNLIQFESACIKGVRVGVLAHAASVGMDGRHAIDLLAKDGANITAIFGPEHGLATRAQDMEPVESHEDESSHIPVYSLYGDTFESLSPTSAMLENIDVMVVDLQDIGSRYYTYIWTTVLCMKACAAAGKKVLVCDRPNPLGGIEVEGALPSRGFESFVGLYPLPVRHGMTIGEIARYVNDEFKIGCDLTVIPMEGWRREMLWPDWGCEWVNPSPNMRSFTAALVYPGMCLLEGTNVSEGRGTDTPFEIIGAPFIDSEELMELFASLKLPGVHVAPTTFIPTMQKHRSSLCNGIRWVVEDVQKFKPYLTGLGMIWAIHRLYRSSGFAWRTEQYEFVKDIPAIDLLTGSAEFREKIDGEFSKCEHLTKISPSFMATRGKFLMY